MPLPGMPKGFFLILCIRSTRNGLLSLMISSCFSLPDVVIVSVVMGILLAVAVVVILVLLAVVLKQRKQIQLLTVASPHGTPHMHPNYEDVADITSRQNIELTTNVAYGQVEMTSAYVWLYCSFFIVLNLMVCA